MARRMRQSDGEVVAGDHGRGADTPRGSRRAEVCLLATGTEAVTAIDDEPPVLEGCRADTAGTAPAHELCQFLHRQVTAVEFADCPGNGKPELRPAPEARRGTGSELRIVIATLPPAPSFCSTSVAIPRTRSCSTGSPPVTGERVRALPPAACPVRQG